MRIIEYFDLVEISLLSDGTHGIGIKNIKYKDMNQKEREEKLALLQGFDLNCFYDRVMVIPDTAEKTTKSGIIIPDTVQEKPRKGTVVMVGPDVEGTDSPEIRPNAKRAQPGMTIVYGKYAGSEMKVNGVDVVLLRESDILFSYGKEIDIEL